MAKDTYSRLIELLNQNKAHYRLIDHKPEGRSELVSKMRGNALKQAANCIVVMVKVGKKMTKFVLAVYPADKKLDLETIKNLYNGTYVSFASENKAEELAGSVLGTVLPFPFNKDLELIVDPSLLNNEEIFFNAARLDQSVVLKAADYKRIAKPRLESIVQGATPKRNEKKPEPEIDDLYRLRHSLSHVLAQAVQNLWPDTKISIGPPIDTGCYYDFYFKEPISENDFPKIEKDMRRIINQGQTFKVDELSTDESIKIWKKKKQPFKVELVEDLAKAGETKVTHYRNIDKEGKETFVDLCKGGHVDNFNKIPADCFKIMSLAGAYWRGDEKREQLTRLYVAAFASKQELKEYLFMLEEAKKRDHRKLGKELDLFSLHMEGQGFPFWHAKGTEVFLALQRFLREKNKEHGYTEIMTPMILNRELWEQSGHWDKFRENMYFTEIDDVTHAVKPMNCPGGLVIFRNEMHSYRDFPIRRAEFGYVHRHEKSGVLYGLFRVRAFTQDDAHVFCIAKQLNAEIINMVNYAIEVYSQCGFKEYEIFIATRPDKYIGSDEDWEVATVSLKNALEEKGLSFKIKEGEGAFYGPKIEFNIRDCLGRNWQCGTIQVDFSMPKRLGAEYTDDRGNKQAPIMLHRAIAGSLERYLGIMIEHFAGLFPLWLAPVQVAILPVAGAHEDYARLVENKLKDKGFRTEYYDSTESLGKRIRQGEKNKIPYLLVLGDKESKQAGVSVRNIKSKNQVEMPLSDFIYSALTEDEKRQLEYAIG